MVVLWQVAQLYFARVHTSDALERALDDQGEADVVAVLPFTPEPFHSEFFTDCCSVARVEGSSFYLTGLSKADVRHIAEQYWVEKVDLWNGASSG